MLRGAAHAGTLVSLVAASMFALAACGRVDPLPVVERSQAAIAREAPTTLSAAETPAPSLATVLPHDLLHPGGDPTVCRCVEARPNNGWCPKHACGFVAGVAVPSELLFETLDPHGHVIGHESVTCRGCQHAIAEDGWCPVCRMGWHDGLAWMTRLTWTLAGGHPLEAATACEACRRAVLEAGTADPRWCETCGHGLVGSVVFENRNDFDRAAHELAILRTAVSNLDRCALCACAIMMDEECPKCRIQYVDGQRVAVLGPADP
ncbi:MAG: hypothetical protein KDA22_00910 [Phycisphaerales bacterium]|nr:hypothetical protein [Phycisphaerales bacterium]